MRKRRRTSKVDARTLRAKQSFKKLVCSTRGCTREVEVDREIETVLCWECVQKLVGIDPKLLQQTKKPVKKETGFPRGWHLYKRFVHADGRVFVFGKEKTKLQGKYPPTEIKVNTLTKSQRRRLREEKQLRREKRLAKQYKKKMELKEEKL